MADQRNNSNQSDPSRVTFTDSIDSMPSRSFDSNHRTWSVLSSDHVSYPRRSMPVLYHGPNQYSTLDTYHGHNQYSTLDTYNRHGGYASLSSQRSNEHNAEHHIVNHSATVPLVNSYMRSYPHHPHASNTMNIDLMRPLPLPMHRPDTHSNYLPYQQQTYPLFSSLSPTTSYQHQFQDLDNNRCVCHPTSLYPPVHTPMSFPNSPQPRPETMLSSPIQSEGWNSPNRAPRFDTNEEANVPTIPAAKHSKQKRVSKKKLPDKESSNVNPQETSFTSSTDVLDVNRPKRKYQKRIETIFGDNFVVKIPVPRIVKTDIRRQ